MRPYQPDMMIVEDDPLVRDVLLRYVGELLPATTAHACETGEEALDALKQFRPRSIILDIHLSPGGVSGLDILDCLNTMGLSIPIVVITADPEADIRATAMQYEFVVDFLIKPRDIGRLSAMLRRLVLHIVRGILKESIKSLGCHECPYRKLWSVSRKNGRLAHATQ